MKKLIITTTTYIIPCFIIFMAILAIFVYPYQFPLHGNNANCVLGDPPTSSYLINLPTVENFGPSRTAKSNFIMVRSNVPANDLLGFFKPPDPFLEPNQDDSHLVQVDYMPNAADFGENPQKPGYDEFYPYGGADGKVYPEGEQAYTGKGFSLINLGLIFYRNKDPKTIREMPTADPSIFHNVYLVDIYQDITIANQPGSTELIQELLKCTVGEGNTGAIKHPLKVMIPDQKQSLSNEQLQLEWFAFKSEGIWNIHCKPAVYLYPSRKQRVNVKVFPAGTLTYTDPQYDDKTGWTVDAYPNGEIYDSRFTIYDKAFPYLYFESKVPDQIIKKPTKGWVVKYEELDSFYKDTLPKLGLNQQQTTDFAEYWTKALKKAPYYFVGVIDQANVDQIERLEITPKPDYINRVRIYFERLDQPKQVEAPEIANQPISGSADQLFRVVEWGGMVKNDPSHPFTCSQ